MKVRLEIRFRIARVDLAFFLYRGASVNQVCGMSIIFQREIDLRWLLPEEFVIKE